MDAARPGPNSATYASAPPFVECPATTTLAAWVETLTVPMEYRAQTRDIIGVVSCETEYFRDYVGRVFGPGTPVYRLPADGDYRDQQQPLVDRMISRTEALAAALPGNPVIVVEGDLLGDAARPRCFEVLKALRARLIQKDMRADPIIVLATCQPEVDWQAAMDAGANIVVSDPSFDNETLTVSVRAIRAERDRYRDWTEEAVEDKEEKQSRTRKSEWARLIVTAVLSLVTGIIVAWYTATRLSAQAPAPAVVQPDDKTG